MKTLGLLGGMTWQTTVLYYEEINKAVRARLGGAHAARLLLYSVDMAEMLDLFNADDWSAVANVLGDAAVGLKAAGADAILIGANLPHRVADQVEKRVAPLPLLHIADFTAQKVLQSGAKRVALLGTKPVMEQGFYKERLASKFGLEVVTPDAETRQALHEKIFKELSAGIVTEETGNWFVDLCKTMIQKEHVDCLILACTELRLVLQEGEVSVPFFETAALHAQGAAAWAVAEGKSQQNGEVS